MLLARGPALGPDDFESGPGRGPESGVARLKDAAREAGAATERRLIRAALEATGGNVTRAAERLGVSRRGLQIKVKELGLRD